MEGIQLLYFSDGERWWATYSIEIKESCWTGNVQLGRITLQQGGVGLVGYLLALLGAVGFMYAPDRAHRLQGQCCTIDCETDSADNNKRL